ncbi:helix-turn-helix transcriptional regulator [Ruthenibacterium lactatiformans]|uniref:helix-turn-helix transcriptional regulator n=1 Tax=Ruthenibacterium lactatiformans TaxID=1550024 RepID=UPI003A4E1E2C
MSETFTVKQARLLSGITQQRMADLLGVHRTTYRKIEKNPDLASVKQAREIAKITGIDVDQIFFAQQST